MRHARCFLLLALACAPLVLPSCGEKPKPTPSFALGEKVTVGHLVYTAFETQWLTHLNEGANARVPQNRFFVIRLSVSNSASTPATVPNFAVEDDRGNSYPELNNGDQVPQWLGYLKQVAATDSLQGTILFDVPPGHYRLRVLDEDSQRSALIDIPLSFTPDTPTLPQPQSK